MGWLRTSTPPVDILDQPLMALTAQDMFTMRDLLQNVSILGQPGSGKTSGSGAHLAKAILLSGAGMLVLCAKADERALWERYCAQTGRTGSLVIFDGKRHRYNFIAAELARHGIEGINIIIECVMQVLDAARALSGNAKKGDVFWEDIIRLLLRYSLTIIYLATGTISVSSVIAFIRSAPRSDEEANTPEWQQSSFFFQCFATGKGRIDPALMQQVLSFWREQWMTLDQKTKSNAEISLCTTLDRFNHGWLREAFTTDSTMAPELLTQGAVIVLDMPALTHMDDGLLAQRLMKFITQRVLLARQSYGPEHASRPVVIWMDEAHLFVDAHDAKFMALGRSALCASVLMAQSLPTYRAVMAGENSADRVGQLLGNCTTKIWHSTSCPSTAKDAAETLGKTLYRRANHSRGSGSSTNHGFSMGLGENWGTNQSSGSSASYSSGQNGNGTSSRGFNSSSGSSEGGNANRGRSGGYSDSANVSDGWSEQLSYILEPAEFGRMLKTGGPANGNIASAVWYQAGRTFAASGGPALLVEFRQ